MMRYGRFGILVFVLLLGMVSLRSEGVQVVKSKTHGTGHQKLGTAIISDLQGNVRDAGDHYNISGTNVTVRMYVKNSWPSTLHSCDVLLGTSMLAASSYEVKVNPAASQGQDTLATDCAGNWQSAVDRGYVKFDSTAGLPSGTQGDLNVYLFRGDGALLHSKNPIPAVHLYNKAYVLSDEVSFDYAKTTADHVNATLQGMNHSTRRTHTDEADTIRSEIATYTVFYTYSHGGFGSSGTCFYDTSGNNAVWSDEVVNSVGNKTSQPYYTLVYMDTCETADANDMAKAFGILDSAGAPRADRAYLGWEGTSRDWGPSSNFTKDLWTRLESGDTIGEAFNFAKDRHRILFGTPVLMGDKNTTLHRVYCGTIGY